jgi:hypothetical protein
MKLKSNQPKTVETAPAPAVQHMESIIRRIIHILIDDFWFKVKGIKSEDRYLWEDYERFCKMIRER